MIRIRIGRDRDPYPYRPPLSASIPAIPTAEPYYEGLLQKLDHVMAISRCRYGLPFVTDCDNPAILADSVLGANSLPLLCGANSLPLLCGGILYPYCVALECC